jgi:hypothetical protein
MSRLSPWLKRIALGFLALDLVIFAQFIRVPWMPPDLLQRPPRLFLYFQSNHFSDRIYHPPFLTEMYAKQSLKGVDDYIFMKESLMPSHGMAFGIREVKSYQELTLKSADLYQKRLLAAGAHSPLAQWAGISTVFTLHPHADHVGPDTVGLLHLKSPEKPVFIFNRQAGDQVDRIQQSPGLTTASVRCASAHCLVVFSEMDYPGWKVRVDHVPTQHEPFEQAFLAAEVGPGPHQIIFQFQSRTFQLGLILSLATLLFVALAVVMTLF